MQASQQYVDQEGGMAVIIRMGVLGIHGAHWSEGTSLSIGIPQ